MVEGDLKEQIVFSLIWLFSIPEPVHKPSIFSQDRRERVNERRNERSSIEIEGRGRERTGIKRLFTDHHKNTCLS